MYYFFNGFKEFKKLLKIILQYGLYCIVLIYSPTAFSESTFSEKAWDCYAWREKIANLRCFSNTSFKGVARSYMNYFDKHNSPINPKGRLFHVKRPWNYNQLELTLEQRFNDNFSLQLWNVDSFAPLHHSGTLLEGYLCFKDDRYTLMAGKVRVNWGWGFGRDPFDVFRRNVRVAFDPDNEPRLQEGINMCLLNYTLDNTSFTLVYAKHAIIEPRKYPSQLGVKATINIENTEYTAFILKRFHLDTNVGVGANALVTDSLIFRAEILSTNLRDRFLPFQQSQSIFENSKLVVPARFGYDDRLLKRIYFRTLLGFDYTFEDSQIIQPAYYLTTHGYSSNEWRIINNGIISANQLKAWDQFSGSFASPQGNPYRGFLLNTASILKNLPLRKNYLSLHYASNRKFEKYQWNGYVEQCIDDKSWVFYLDFCYFLTDSITVRPSITFFKPKTISQYGLIPNKFIGNILFRWDI